MSASAPQGSRAHSNAGPGSPAGTGAVAFFALLTILAGLLSPMQSAVNGRLGEYVQDGHLAALISFGSGLVLMLVVIFARRSTRASYLSLPRHLARGTVPWPNFFAGMCGVVIVLSQGVSVGALGVATFQTSLISGMVISGVLCDRLGIGVEFKQALSAFRIVGAALAVLATVLVVSPNFEAPSVIAFAILPFAGGLLAGWQPAGNSTIGKLADSMLVSITWNFTIGFSALLLAFLIRLGLGQAQFVLPPTWWMYLGGPLGLASIGLMALLVRKLGLLLLSLASTAGQLIGSILLDLAMPTLGHAIHPVTIAGTVVALIAAGVAMIPSRRIDQGPGLDTAVAGQSGIVRSTGEPLEPER